MSRADYYHVHSCPEEGCGRQFACVEKECKGIKRLCFACEAKYNKKRTEPQSTLVSGEF